MTDDVTETAILQFPDAFWPDAMKVLRKLRELHREAGETSRLVRGGDLHPRLGRIYTLTVTGSPIAVSDAVRNARKIQDAIDAKRERSTDEFLRKLRRRKQQIERERERRFADLLLQVMTTQRK